MNLRISNNDFIKTHLIFALFNHAVVTNHGFILVNGVKKSQLIENFRTIQDMVMIYGVDATRFRFDEAGDLLDNANYELKFADTAILKLTTLEIYLEKISQLLSNYHTLAQSKNIDFFQLSF